MFKENTEFDIIGMGEVMLRLSLGMGNNFSKQGL